MTERDNTLINAVKRGIAKQRWNVTSAGWKDGSWAEAVEPVEALIKKRIARARREAIEQCIEAVANAEPLDGGLSLTQSDIIRAIRALEAVK